MVLQGNKFPLLFQRAAEAAKVDIETDGFNTCVAMVSHHMHSLSLESFLDFEQKPLFYGQNYSSKVVSF